MLENSISLQSYNTFGLPVIAAQIGIANSAEDILKIKEEAKLPLYVLGGGSNILFTKDPAYCIIKNEIAGIEILDQSATDVQIKVGSGVNWHELVLWTLERNYGGLENLSLIPGTVGAAPMQNIGAYGVEVESCFVSLEAIHLETGEKLSYDHNACMFGYRDSIFKHKLKGKLCISSVSLKLSLKDHAIKSSYAALQEELEKLRIVDPSIRDISNAVIAIRRSKLPDPKELGNAGSFFKNPEVDRTTLESIQKRYIDIPFYPLENGKVKIPAGWLIEKRGWKGKRIGNTGSHVKQALVLVNYGNATGNEIYTLAMEIISDIKDHFDIELSPEVNIV
ncbi:MAG TPA: UDP-N-acetylmuramate dehydrogenase [Saprospiraceae bacterium]|nr:UDP-N-acetylmuramate dehydrogenase [Saprospiraceae bacterium]